MADTTNKTLTRPARRAPGRRFCEACDTIVHSDYCGFDRDGSELCLTCLEPVVPFVPREPSMSGALAMLLGQPEFMPSLPVDEVAS